MQAETQSPFESSIKSPVKYFESLSESACGEGDCHLSRQLKVANYELRQTVQLLEQQLAERDHTIRLLQQQMVSRFWPSPSDPLQAKYSPAYRSASRQTPTALVNSTTQTEPSPVTGGSRVDCPTGQLIR